MKKWLSHLKNNILIDTVTFRARKKIKDFITAKFFKISMTFTFYYVSGYHNTLKKIIRLT